MNAIDVVVIGAGVGGLAAAARLGAAGHRVEVFEASTRVGGKLEGYRRDSPAGPFLFDTGPSLLTMPWVFADLFAATGTTLDAELDLVALDPIVRHVFADGAVLDSCADPDELARRVGAVFGARAERQWRRLWHRAGRVWHASWRHVLSREFRSPLALAGLAWRLGDLATVAPGRTLAGLARGHLSDPRLRMMLGRYATYTGSDPRRAPAALAAIVYAELGYGGWYLRGGLATLADALVRRCLAHGVRVHTGTPVVAIDTAGGRARGVRLADGTRVPATLVVSNVDHLSLHRDLLPPATGATGARAGVRAWGPAGYRAGPAGGRGRTRTGARAAQRSLSGFVLLLGVRGRTPGLAHHTVFFPPPHRYHAEFDAIFDPAAARPAREPTIFVTVADDPAVRPDDHEAWFVLVNAAPHGPGPASVDWDAPGLADRYADHVLSVLARRGLEVRDRLLFRDIRTPADLQRNTWTPGGAIYGTPSHGLRGLRRPANRGPVPGLWSVGGSVHPGGGLPLAAVSAALLPGLPDTRPASLTAPGLPDTSDAASAQPVRPACPLSGAARRWRSGSRR